MSKTLVAARLRGAREMAGLSQGQVGKLLGLHRPTISEIEAGRRSVKADELAQFARLYRVDLAWLAGESQDVLEKTDPRIRLAARELSRLKSSDLDRILRLLAALRAEAPPADAR